MSDPDAPAFMYTAPPTDPGMAAAHSRPLQPRSAVRTWAGELLWGLEKRGWRWSGKVTPTDRR